MPAIDDTLTLDLRGVTKRFGRLMAVDGVDLAVAPGEFLTIFGPNGAGKTTLLRLMAGLAQVTSGTIAIGGMDIRGDHDELRKLIGFISHQPFVYGPLTPMENLMFFGELYGADNLRGRAEALLDEVGLFNRANDPVRTFSRGMLQRLSIARALIHDPSILFLDEPFSGLDQHAAKTLKRQLSRLHTERRTIVMITHNLDLGVEMGTRVALQVAGRIHFDKPSDQFDHAQFNDLYFTIVGEAHC